MAACRSQNDCALGFTNGETRMLRVNANYCLGTLPFVPCRNRDENGNSTATVEVYNPVTAAGRLLPLRFATVSIILSLRRGEQTRQNLAQMKTTTLPLEHPISRVPFRLALLLILLALTYFALSPQARGVCQDACLTNNNTVQGDNALLNLTTGTDNTALGFNALLSDTTGAFNIAVGSQALTSNTTGGNNVAIGWQALFSNDDGNLNIAIGNLALYENISGNENIAIGELALNANTASNNTAIGFLAARYNTFGNSNTAVGSAALYAALGSNNCAFGASALGADTTGSGSNNTAVGTDALFLNYGSNNTAIGTSAGDFIQAGNNNIFIGVSAGRNVQGGSSNIEIGSVGLAGDSRSIRIGTNQVQRATFIAGISGATVPTGVAVIVDANGHLGTTTSSARFKEAIKPMDKASEAILSLKPVTFHYKHELDPAGAPQFGLVAEEVAKVNPDLVARDEQGKPYTVRYDAVNAMLLNEFLKEHSTVQQQQKEIDALKTQLNEQAALIREVNGKLEMSKPALQVVNHNQ